MFQRGGMTQWARGGPAAAQAGPRSPLPLGLAPACLVDTLDGPVPAGDLGPGHAVLTRDSGYRPVRWVGCDTRSARGDACPHAPGQRLLLCSDELEALCGEREAFARAGDLGRAPLDRKAGGYVVILLDTHEVIRAGGDWTESFEPGRARIAALPADCRADLLGRFPALGEPGGRAAFRSARPTLSADEVRCLAAGRRRAA